MLHFQEWISTYGYLGIFVLLMLGIVGLPVPDETLLVFSGYLIFRGTLHPAGVFVAAFSGSASGISISYLVGRVLGLRIVSRYGRFFGVSELRVKRVHDWFAGLGHWALVFGYFMPGVRHFTAIIAGVSGLEFAAFMVFAYLGALVWVATFLSIGYFFGDNWSRVSEAIHEHLVLASCAVGGVFCCYLLVRRFMGGRRVMHH